MNRFLRVLLVEDSEDDAVLLVRDLRRGGYEVEVERVETADALRAALERQRWDVVLSDYSLPNFDAPAALEIVKSAEVDAPFIIVSGAIGEETAVAALKAGAHDFIVKGRTARLLPAIERELRDAEEARRRKEAERDLQAAERRFRALVENNANGIVMTSVDGTFLYGSPAITRLLGYTDAEWLGRNGFELVHPEDLQKARATRVAPGSTGMYEVRLQHRDGTFRWVEAFVTDLTGEPSVGALVFNLQDISERREMLAAQAAQAAEIEKMREFLQTTLDSFAGNTVVLDPKGVILYANKGWEQSSDEMRGQSAAHFRGGNYLTLTAGSSGPGAKDVRAMVSGIRAVIAGGKDEFLLEYAYRGLAEERWFNMMVTPFPEAAPRRVVVVHSDISERKRSDLALLQYNHRLQYRHAIDTAILAEDLLERVARQVLDAIQRELGILRASVALFDRKTNESVILVVEAQATSQAPSGTRYSMEVYGAEVLDSLRAGKEYHVGEIDHLVPSNQYVETLRAEGVRAFAWLPLRSHDELLGTVNLGADSIDTFSSTRIENVIELVAPLAIAIQQTRYREQIASHVGELERRVKVRTAELSHAKDRTESILTSLSDAVILMATDGDIQEINLAAKTLFGYGLDEMRNQPLSKLVSPESEATLARMIGAVVQTRASVTVEVQAQRKDGSLIDVEMAIAPLMKEGNPTGIVGSLRDISERREIERALAEGEARYRLLFENANAAILVANEAGIYLDANRAAEVLTGYKRAELLGLSVADLSAPIMPTGGKEMFQEFVEVGRMEGEYFLLRKDGTTVEVEFSAGQISPGRYQSILYDVSERKRFQRTLEASEERYRALVDFAPDPIVIVDQKGRIVLVNRRVAEFTGYASAELLGELVEVLVPESDRLTHVAQRVEYSAAPITRAMGGDLDLKIRRKDGTTISVAIGVSPVQAGEETLIMAYITDITAQRRLEAGLRGALAKERELNELRTRFISMVSHDFRTPLSVVQSSIDILRTYYDRLDETRRASHFGRIETQIERMTRLLDDVLTVSQADAGKIRFQPILGDVDQVCRDLAEQFQSAPTFKHTLVYRSSGGPVRVPLDEKLLQQVVINLLTNAFKYSPEGSSVRFELAVDEEKFVIRIQDSGMGIPEADQAQLFESFHRASNVGTIQGTGLGLAIVKRAVVAQGGTITFESAEGVGTTFVITIPIIVPIEPIVEAAA